MDGNLQAVSLPPSAWDLDVGEYSIGDRSPFRGEARL